MQTLLEPEEIRLLSKMRNCRISMAMLNKLLIDKFLDNGLLCYSDYQYELGKLTVTELKKIAAANRLSEKGKKAELIKHILSSVSDDKLKALQLQRYYVLTEQGERVVEENSALLLWYNGLRHEYINPADIIATQKAHRDRDDTDILFMVYQDRLQKCETDLERLSLLTDIKRIYQWKKDEQGIANVSTEIAEVDKRLSEAWTEQYNSIDFGKATGLTSKERKAIRDKALEELDENWGKEIDAKYRSMAENSQ